MPRHAAVPASRNDLSVRMDTLEPRLLLSSTLEIAPVTFRGVTAEAQVGRFNVVVRAGANFEQIAARQGFTDVRALGGGIYSFQTSKAPEAIAKWTAKSPNVLASSPDYVLTTQRVPNDPAFGAQYHLGNTGQAIPSPVFVPLAPERTLGRAGEDINVQPAWEITTGNSDVVIAIIDTGLDVGHGDLAANIWVNPFEIPGDGIDNDGNGFVDDIHGWDFADGNADLTDDDGHGTAVAGVAAAVGNNGKGVSGVAWNAKLMGVKVFGSRESASVTSAVIAGVNYITDMALRGVPIAAANASLGGPTFFFDPVVTASLRRLSEAGVVFVGAAGNSSSNNDRIADFPTRNSILIPGNISVAATDNQGRLSDFSSFGARTVQVAAPGTSIFTTASRSAPDTGFFTDADGDTYTDIDGTSFSAPIVAGMVALARSVAPNATPAEIADAIYRGVDVLPSLVGATPRAPNLVTTGGRVNVLNTLQIISNKVVSTNTTASGDWPGRFGASGQFIYGGTTDGPTFPNLVSPLVPDGATVDELRVRRNSTAGLLLPDQDFTRSNSALNSPQTMRFDFDFTAAGSRRLTLYMADLDNRNRVQTVRVVSTETGLELNSTTLQRFQEGRYLTLELSGRVSVEIVPVRGSAVLNGLFLDPVPTGQNAFVRADTLTGGNWINSYGDNGLVLPGLVTALPAGVTVTTTANTVIGRASRDALVPESPASTTARSTGVFTTPGPFDVQVNVGSSPREVSFYLYNTGRTPVTQRVQLLDPTTGAVVAERDVLLQRSGAYVTFHVSGDNTFRFHALGGGAPALGGVFFNSAQRPGSPGTSGGFFVGSNTTLGGQWRGTFGVNGQFVVGAQTSFPSFVSSSPTPTAGGSVTLVNGNTRDRSAPQNPNLTRGNIVGYVQTQGSTSLQVAIADNSTRRLTAYFVDFDRQRRVQRVELVNTQTGEVLSSQVMRQFERGKYLSWDVTGDVSIRISRLEGPSAVLSAVFFD